MKVIKICLLFLSLLVVRNSLFASEPFYKSYDWDKEPHFSVGDFDGEIQGVLDRTVVEFQHDKNGNLIEYQKEHKVIYLNSDEEIEKNNKVYLPYSSSSIPIVTKARVIKPNGEIQVLDESKIFTAQDEKTEKEYKYFAFEGLEKGSFIEYIFVAQVSPNFNGKSVIFQHRYLNRNVSFDIYTPRSFWFKFKSYNGLDSIQFDSTLEDKYRWYLEVDTVPELKNESQSAYQAKLQSLIYKLYYNSYNKVRDISSYGGISERFYSIFYKEPEKSKLKILKKILPEIGIAKDTDKEEAIRLIEDYIKRNIHIVKSGSADLSDISFVLSNNVASEAGIIKLYISLFHYLDIKSELVLTSNRYLLSFDPEFEAYNFLTDFLIYLNEQKKYIAPSDISSRFGLPSANLTGNYGLFIKEVSLGDFKTGIGKIKYIKAIPCDETQDYIEFDLKFNLEDLTSTKVHAIRSVSGYSAMGTQPFFHLYNEEQFSEVIEGQINYMLDEEVKLENIEVENDNSKLLGIKPFVVKADFETDQFVEKAGKDFILNIGKFIGPQMEMYQEKDRKLGVESFYERRYDRTLRIEIPEGYSVKNLEVLNFDLSAEFDGEEKMKFSSTFELKGNSLEVNIEEFYKVIRVSLDKYEEYRKVVNGAADFNKISLILSN